MKSFKIKQTVYLPISEGKVGFSLVKGTIIGCREYRTAYSKWRYFVETPLEILEADEFDIYESVDDFISDIPNRVK